MCKLMEAIENLKRVGASLANGNKIDSISTKLKEAGLMSYTDEDVKISKAFMEGMGDARYNNPKQGPKASDELVNKTIAETEIYRRANELILNAQKKQVAYGLDKYPTPLSADVWNVLETIDHILDESIDKLHYLVMLRIHLERMAEEEIEAARQEMEDAFLWNEGIPKDSTFYADGVPFKPESTSKSKIDTETPVGACCKDGVISYPSEYYKDHPDEFVKDFESDLKIDGDGNDKITGKMVSELSPINNKSIKVEIINRLHDDDIDSIAYAVSEMMLRNERRGRSNN